MKNKNLVLISTDLEPGGISTMIGIHTAALIKEGYKVNIILSKDSDAINSIKSCSRLISNKDKLLSINMYNWLDFILLKFGICIWIKKILNNADIIFVHNAKLIKIIKKNTIKPVFAVNHTAKKSQLKYFKKADMIFSVNNKINDQLINLGVSKKICVYCPNVLIDIPDFKINNVSEKKIVIGALGRMVDKKGFFDFIEALKILKARGINFKAILAGNGELYNTLRNASKDLSELEFPGWVKDKKDFYNTIDIFCQPSHFEPFGLTIIEAMAYAKPVISTDCDGPSEIIIDNKNGFLVKKKNPQEIAEVIIKLINNSEIYRNTSISARKHIENFYIINSLQKVLRNNINNYFKSKHEK
jgi:glycosyltransferase involved in cell wall biosynthesis